MFGKIVPKSSAALEHVKFKVAYAESEIRILDEGKVCMQYYGNYLYYMEVWEIWLDNDVVLPFEVLDFSLFLFLMLEGDASFTNLEGQDLAQAEQATCYITSNVPGNFCLHLSKGKHILTYACPRLEWLKRHQESFPLLIDFISKSQSLLAEASYMKKIEINRAIGRNLFNLWKVNSNECEDLELELSKRFKQLLKSYYNHLSEKERLSFYTTEEKIIEINNYLKKHFQNPEIGNLRFLCNKFLITERTFSRAFYRINTKNLASYLNDLRLEYACGLLLSSRSTLSIQQVSTMCF